MEKRQPIDGIVSAVHFRDAVTSPGASLESLSSNRFVERPSFKILRTVFLPSDLCLAARCASRVKVHLYRGFPNTGHLAPPLGGCCCCCSGFHNPPGSPPKFSIFRKIPLRVKQLLRESRRGEVEVGGRSPPAGTGAWRDEYRFGGSLCLPRSLSDQAHHCSIGCRAHKKLHQLQER
jgi:hypothetical protein